MVRKHPGIEVTDITCDVVAEMIGTTVEGLGATDSPALLAYLGNMPIGEGEDPSLVLIERVAREVARIKDSPREPHGH